MSSYNGNTLDLGHCKSCGMNPGAHRPGEAYHGEMKLEGKMSSSTAKRAGCQGYENSHCTFTEVMRQRYCARRWRDCQRGLFPPKEGK